MRMATTYFQSAITQQSISGPCQLPGYPEHPPSGRILRDPSPVVGGSHPIRSIRPQKPGRI